MLSATPALAPQGPALAASAPLANPLPHRSFEQRPYSIWKGTREKMPVRRLTAMGDDATEKHYTIGHPFSATWKTIASELA